MMFIKKRLVTCCQIGLCVFSMAPVLSAYSNQMPAGGFIENKGQWPSQVLFSLDLHGGRLFVERSRLVYVFYETPHQHDIANEYKSTDSNEKAAAHAFELRFINSRRDVAIHANEAAITRFNYYIGSDDRKWVRGARSFGSVELRDIYPGVSLKLYKSGDSFKYDLIVTPQGKIEDILLEYNGVDSLGLVKGNLHVKTSLGELTELRPYAFVNKNDGTTEVKCHFNLKGRRVSFNTPDGWDKRFPLVIDPMIVFSAYSGSTADNWGNTATYDDFGNLYSAGIVSSAGYPVKTGAYQSLYNGGSWDIGIMKFDSAGTRLIYATYLGGRSSETPQSLLVNHAGELLVLGTTSSTNFPVTNGSSFAGGNGFEPMNGVPYSNGSDLFIAKLSADGNTLLGSTYAGGSRNDGINFVSGEFDTRGMVQSALCRNYGDQFRGDIITDKDDNVYIASNTTSADFLGALNSFGGGTHDAILVKLAADLSRVFWSRYLGGSDTDAAYSLKLDSLSHIFIGGGTNSTNFPGIDGFKTTKGNDIDGWVAEVSPDGSSVVNATYLGTASYDQIYFLDLNSAGEVYVYGQTQGAYPVSPAVFSQTNGGQFIHKLTHDLKNSLFSTVFGSGRNSPNISPTAFLVNDCNKIYLAGWGGALNATTVTYGAGPGAVSITRNFVGGNTNGLRVSNDAYQSTTSGNDFYLMVLDADATGFLYGTFLGGGRSVTHVDGGTSRFDKRGIVYHAVCAGCGGLSDFPAVNSPAGHNRNAARTGSGCNNAAFKFDLATLRAGLQTNSLDLQSPGIDTLCYPSSTIIFQNKSAGGKYFVWDLGDSTVLTKSDTSHVTHTYEPGVYLVTLTAYNDETCEGQDISSVVISVFEPHAEVSEDGRICEGATYQLIASSGVSYQWTSTDPEFTSSDPSPLVAPKESATYYLTVTDASGCQVADTVTVDVIPAPEYALSMEREYDCWNRPGVNFSYSAEDDFAYSWSLGDGTTSSLTSFIYYYPADGTYNATFEAKSDYCFYSEQLTVRIVTVRVPNVITANEDGFNEVMIVEASDRVSVSIFNRWGELVFQDDDYKNNWTGQGVSPGVYYYTIDVENEAICKGWIHVIK